MENAAHFAIAASSVASALSGALLLTAVIGWAGALRPHLPVLWLAGMFTLGGAHVACASIHNRFPALRAHWRVWAALSFVITLAEGVGWGFAPFALADPGNRLALFLAMMVTLCVSAGSVVGGGRYLPTRVAAFVTPTAPYLIFSALSDDRLVRGSFILILVFLAGIGHLGLAADRSFRQEQWMRRRSAALARDLRVQKEAAERANLAKSKFLAAASHDLRQPIHALGLYIGLMRDLVVKPEARALAEKMEISIAAMNRLFGAILDISKLDAGVIQPLIENFALDGLCQRIGDDFRAEAESKGLSVVVEPSGLFVRSDSLLVERILRNFVSNAVRYTDRGGVRVRARRRGNEVVLAVWDSGQGVPRQRMAEIFEEYVQIGNAERDREKGLGLGLAIVRRLCALLGARVEAHSRPGRGSRFAVRLPGAESGAPDVASEASKSPAKGGLVVVIDDDPPVRDAMRAALAAWGFSVIAAPSIASGLALAEGAGEPPSLLMCDYRLPGEDGLQAVESFRARFDARLPAILVTGDTAPERLAQAHLRGVQVLHKPVVPSRLRAAIADLLPNDARDAVLVEAATAFGKDEATAALEG